jgi:uncharacterized protein YlxW (UPF0749 family)
MTGHGDASLSLLNRIVAEALDPGYREAAGRGPSRPLDWRHSLVLAVAIGLLATLVVAAVLQVRQGAPSADQTRAELADRVVAESQALDTTEARVSTLFARVESLQTKALGGTEADRALSAEADALSAAVGLAPVSGSGVEVVLDDGPPAPAGEGGPDLARVLDTDVQLAVNGLFAAGATAVAVNDQRITSLSPIRSAGSAVLVGFRPLVPPYRVTAVGPDGLAEAFAQGSARSQLGDLELSYGMQVDVSPKSDLTVPGRSDLQVRYLRKGEGS